jgi:putative peptidoglycan lipid II flippase
VVGAFTLLSRFTGLARDSVTAALFGGSRMADTFLTSLELTNQVRRVLGEGSLSSFIVPLMTEKRQTQSNEAGWAFFNRVLNLMLVLSAIITVIGVIFGGTIFGWFGGRGLLAHGETFYFQQGAAMTRLLFPYVIGLTLAAVMMGACHTLRNFAVPSFGSVVLNIPMIIAGGLAIWYHKPGENFEAYATRSAWWLCYAVLIGAALRVALMVPTLRRHGWRYQAVLDVKDPELRKLLKMMSLGLADVFLSQINFAVSGYFAMFLAEGIKTYISYANRVIQFPMALTATALGTAMLPQLTQYLLQKRHVELRDMMAFIKRLEIIFMLPAVAGLMILGQPILALIFQHGKFTATDTHGTYLALLFYAPALLPLGWIRMLQPLYFARKDMLTPFKASLASVTVNIVLNWFFAYHTDWKQCGMGLANTLAACTNYAMLTWFLRHELHGGGGEPTRIMETLWKTAVAAVAACGVGLVLFNRLGGWLHGGQGIVGRALAILPIIAVVAGLYFVLVHFLKVPDSDRAVAKIMGRLKKRKAA